MYKPTHLSIISSFQSKVDINTIIFCNFHFFEMKMTLMFDLKSGDGELKLLQEILLKLIIDFLRGFI